MAAALPIAPVRERTETASLSARSIARAEQAVLSQTLQISEFFYSIQGEGLDVGKPCLFVRLAGCNLRCSYCDTPYAWESDGADETTLEDVLSAVASYRVDLVEITGGEPLLQPAVFPLMDALVRRGYRVLLETSGHQDASRVAVEVTRIIDVKTPGSKMSHGRYAANLTSLRPTDQIKFVISDRADYDWAKRRLAEYHLPEKTAALLFSPAHAQLAPRALAAWILADHLPVRLHLQMHKYVWGENVRGV